MTISAIIVASMNPIDRVIPAVYVILSFRIMSNVFVMSNVGEIPDIGGISFFL